MIFNHEIKFQRWRSEADDGMVATDLFQNEFAHFLTKTLAFEKSRF